MSWNKVIDEAKKEVSFRLGSFSHERTQGRVISLKLNVIVNDDNVPILWTIESAKISPVNQGREALKYLDIL